MSQVRYGKTNIQIKKGLLSRLNEFPGTFQNVANRLHEKHCFEVGAARRVILLAEPTFSFSCKRFASFCKEMYEKLACSELAQGCLR